MLMCPVNQECCWIRHVLGSNCLCYELPWVWVVLGTSRPTSIFPVQQELGYYSSIPNVTHGSEKPALLTTNGTMWPWAISGIFRFCSSTSNSNTNSRIYNSNFRIIRIITNVWMKAVVPSITHRVNLSKFKRVGTVVKTCKLEHPYSSVHKPSQRRFRPTSCHCKPSWQVNITVINTLKLTRPHISYTHGTGFPFRFTAPPTIPGNVSSDTALM